MKTYPMVCIASALRTRDDKTLKMFYSIHHGMVNAESYTDAVRIAHEIANKVFKDSRWRRFTGDVLVIDPETETVIESADRIKAAEYPENF